jgi:hypothetical protein
MGVITAFPYPLIWDEGTLDIRVGKEVFEVYFKRQYRQEGDRTGAARDRVEARRSACFVA